MRTFRRFIAEAKSFEGDFAHHPDYLYHGTTEKRAHSILRGGKFARGTYFATHPHMAKTEGEAKVHGDAAMGATVNSKKPEGGKSVVLSVHKSSLDPRHFRKDKEYGSGDHIFGHAFISQRSVSTHGAKVMSHQEVSAHVRKLRGTEPPDV